MPVNENLNDITTLAPFIGKTFYKQIYGPTSVDKYNITKNVLFYSLLLLRHIYSVWPICVTFIALLCYLLYDVYTAAYVNEIFLPYIVCT